MSFNNQVEVSATMPQLDVPENVMNDLTRFIFEIYGDNLPNSLLISQAFILKFPNHGKLYGLSAINYVIEELMKKSLL
jgi:hypothetical protein